MAPRAKRLKTNVSKVDAVLYGDGTVQTTAAIGGGSGTVTGSGTTNKLALWTSSTSVGNSFISQSVNSVSIDSGKTLNVDSITFPDTSVLNSAPFQGQANGLVVTNLSGGTGSGLANVSYVVQNKRVTCTLYVELTGVTPNINQLILFRIPMPVPILNMAPPDTIFFGSAYSVPPSTNRATRARVNLNATSDFVDCTLGTFNTTVSDWTFGATIQFLIV